MQSTATTHSIHDDLRPLTIPAQLSPSRVCKMCESICSPRKTSKASRFFPLVSFTFPSSPSSSDRFIDNPRRRREHFSRLLHHRCILGGSARAIIQSRKLGAAGIFAGCRPSWWGSKAGEGKYSLSRDKANAIFSCRGDGAIFCACCAVWSRNIGPSRTMSGLTSSPSTSSIFNTDSRRKVKESKEISNKIFVIVNKWIC